MRQPLPRKRDRPSQDDHGCPTVSWMGAQKNPIRTELHGGATIANESSALLERLNKYKMLMPVPLDVKNILFRIREIGPLPAFRCRRPL